MKILTFIITLLSTTLALAVSDSDAYKVLTTVTQNGKVVKSSAIVAGFDMPSEVKETDANRKGPNNEVFEQRVRIYNLERKNKKNHLMISSNFIYYSKANKLNLKCRTNLSVEFNKDMVICGSNGSDDTKVSVSITKI